MGDFMIGQSFENAKKYLDNNVALENIDPHAVFPTSISRVCDGFTMATPTSQTIEAVMSTTLTTSIKITRNVLETDNEILAEIYRPLWRCVAVIDDKVEGYFGKQISEYFSANKIELVKLVHAGNEVNKDVQNVEQILLETKKHGVSRNEPVLIVGGGVIADIGGFATGLYHRNTPYIMLCTSIVSGIDAGPSPRTCCDGYGYKNLYGVYHPPILTLTDRYFWKTLHEGWVRHGIGEIIKMACVKDFALFEMLEKAGPKLIKTKFGTVGCEDDQDFRDLCDAIVGRAMESYVRSEYGNLWETHQCRPHAFGHTWSPGYELPGGILHGHAVATCMGYGTYLSYTRSWISKADFERILTEDENLFMPCMVGAMESQFLKMQCQIKGAKRCLDIGTFTGMSAIAMAEGIPEDGKVVTLECYENIAKVAQKIFDKSTVKNKIELVVGKAADEMTKMVKKGNKFDLIFIDADKENYIEYYEIGLKLLAKGGIMLADNSLCALLYDQEGDMRSTRLHLFK